MVIIEESSIDVIESSIINLSEDLTRINDRCMNSMNSGNVEAARIFIEYANHVALTLCAWVDCLVAKNNRTKECLDLSVKHWMELDESVQRWQTTVAQKNILRSEIEAAAIERMCNQWIAEAQDFPDQHEDKGKGSSTYNWQTHYANAGLIYASRIRNKS